MSQGPGVVEPQNLEVRDPQTVPFDGIEYLGQRRGIGAWKNVLSQPRAGGSGRAHMPDGMDQRDPVIVQEVIDLGEEFAVMVDPDVFEHSDRDNAIEAPRHLAIILELEADAVAHASTLGPALGAFVLLLGKRDPNDLDVAHGREIERKLAPAATDVQHSETRREVELGGQEPQLVALRLLQGVVVAQKVGTGILHALIQEQPIEIVP